MRFFVLLLFLLVRSTGMDQQLKTDGRTVHYFLGSFNNGAFLINGQM